MHADLALHMMGDLFRTALVACAPVLALTMLVGLAMMPPSTISLPLKILMFVLIDGWSLLLKALVGSFH
jgi:flagellar biosynthesis protein FliP